MHDSAILSAGPPDLATRDQIFEIDVSLLFVTFTPATRTLRRTLATSEHWMVRTARRAVRRVKTFGLPVPAVVARPFLFAFVFLRTVYYWCFRVFIAEPLFKAYCRSYGRNVRTDVFIHWVQGRGDLIIGDDVLIDGKCTFTFAARFGRPTLTVGSGTGIGHNCGFTVGKKITIGSHCRIAAGVWMFDSYGHPSDPQARLENRPPAEDEVKPIVVADNVWIGGRAVIFPGVTIGEGSIVSACAVVTSDVAPYSIVAGNPARRIGVLPTGQPADK
jgi:acetyltransferase-like isoleucine patch superfamily enzyme